MGLLDWLEQALKIDGRAAEEHRRARRVGGMVTERGQQVTEIVAEKVEKDALEKIEKGNDGGDDALAAKGEAELRLAEEIRQGGEAALLVAMGVLGRPKND